MRVDRLILLEVGLGSVHVVTSSQVVPRQVLKDPVSNACSSVVGKDVISTIMHVCECDDVEKAFFSPHLLDRMLSSPGNPNLMISAIRLVPGSGSVGKPVSLDGMGTSGTTTTGAGATGAGATGVAAETVPKRGWPGRRCTGERCLLRRSWHTPAVAPTAAEAPAKATPLARRDHMTPLNQPAVELESHVSWSVLSDHFSCLYRCVPCVLGQWYMSYVYEQLLQHPFALTHVL